jgi:hypothetical protein
VFFSLHRPEKYEAVQKLNSPANLKPPELLTFTLSQGFLPSSKSQGTISSPNLGMDQNVVKWIFIPTFTPFIRKVLGFDRPLLDPNV